MAVEPRSVLVPVLLMLSVTHHCNTLESAGLIERVRQGKRILVRRTTRGAGPVELFT
ncbi:hypothetical protein [Kribbella soli]|uniref:hypothetical protein n=1 Tax=Kribbella soli TaxID=1124743 RepID=UPI0013F4A9C0|nr:hypothetical protein [Kribbella soli]